MRYQFMAFTAEVLNTSKSVLQYTETAGNSLYYKCLVAR